MEIIINFAKKTIMKKLLILPVMALAVACAEQQKPVASTDIIPLPQHIQIYDEDDPDYAVFELNNNTIIVADNEDNFNANYLQSYLKNLINADFEIDTLPIEKNYIELIVVEKVHWTDFGLPVNDEAYYLRVDESEIDIYALTEKGIFYGIQTLLQLLPDDIYMNAQKKLKKCALPSMVIKDYPRFEYRAMMLDCSRTFYDVDYIKHFIDGLAYHKINNFHWHLTDDQGWRIEIDKYPKLTELGAWRGENEALMPAYSSGMERNGGFYSKEQIKDIVKYASDRNVNIIPEIDLPGHSKAVAVAYPEIVCPIDNVHLSVQGESNNVWCVAREENYDMLEDIIVEMLDLFPSKIYNIGADEVNMNSWKDCPHCQKLMKEKGMKQLVELQNYFVRRMEAILNKHGKVMAGWDEILDGGKLLPDTRVHAWQNLERGIKSVKAGHPTVMQVSQYMYFDMKQSEGERGLRWAGIIPLEKVYEFDPIGTFTLNDEEKKLVLGVEGGLWTECGQVDWYADYQMFPKICALSEIGWTNFDKRNVDDFKKRLFNSHLERLYNMDFKFRVNPPVVTYENGQLVAEKDFEFLEIRYTNDKSDPTKISLLYETPITTDNPENYRFAAFYKERSSVVRGADNVDLYKFMSPKTKVESNVPTNENINDLVDYNFWTYCNTSRKINEGDYFLFTFEQPVECSKIWMATGHYTLGIIGIPNGNIEFSYDGVNFERGSDFFHDDFDGYIAECYPVKPVKAVRINVTGIGEGELAIIQDLRIEP